ncbi:unnamed protein product [Urochloa humidicola]
MQTGGKTASSAEARAGEGRCGATSAQAEGRDRGVRTVGKDGGGGKKGCRKECGLRIRATAGMRTPVFPPVITPGAAAGPHRLLELARCRLPYPVAPMAMPCHHPCCCRSLLPLAGRADPSALPRRPWLGTRAWSLSAVERGPIACCR